MEGIHCHDGVKIAIKGNPGDRATVIGMTLRSDTEEQVYGFNKSANEKLYPIGRSDSLKASIIRQGKKTFYNVLITWDMINRQGPPLVGTGLPFSILVCKDDEDIQYGLQWFHGIIYDNHEGDEAWMGELWFE